jgi:predicted secreted protein
MLQIWYDNWGGYGAVMSIGAMFDMLTILLFGTMFAAVMHGVFQLIKTLLIRYF